MDDMEVGSDPIDTVNDLAKNTLGEGSLMASETVKDIMGFAQKNKFELIVLGGILAYLYIK